MTKDVCMRCGQAGHTSSSCKRPLTLDLDGIAVHTAARIQAALRPSPPADTAAHLIYDLASKQHGPDQ